MAVAIARNADYSKQAERAQGDEAPCIICGKPIKPGSSRYWVRVGNGGQDVVTPDEAAQDPGGDLGAQPLGANCLRKHPELKPYAVAAKSETPAPVQADPLAEEFPALTGDSRMIFERLLLETPVRVRGVDIKVEFRIVPRRWYEHSSWCVYDVFHIGAKAPSRRGLMMSREELANWCMGLALAGEA